MTSASHLPEDTARCRGDGCYEDGEQHWREGCEDCLRRTAPGGRVWIDPPSIIAFECEYRIRPDDLGVAA
jgi:hypothetical protein